MICWNTYVYIDLCLRYNLNAFSLFAVSLSLVIMVFVNYGGGRYWFFRHESWNGETQLVLPLCLFIFLIESHILITLVRKLCIGEDNKADVVFSQA